MVKRGRIVAFFLLVLLIGSLMGTTLNGIVNNIKLGLDLQGGFEILYEVKPAKEGDVIDRDVLLSTVEALDRRVNVLGVSEPNIQIEGEDRIRVQLAGVDDQNTVREILSTQAKLTFRDVNDNIMLDGTDLVENGAKQSFAEQNQPIVSLKLKDANLFKEVTEDILAMGVPNNLLVIWLDFEEGVDSYAAEALKAEPKFISAPRVSQILNTSDVQIEGNFTVESADQLADLLNAGSLPVDLEEIYSTSVGAKFGETALQKTVFAGMIGIAIIFLFMIFYYRFPGIIAVVTLSIYIFLILQIFDWMNAVLTLPGIAALLLGVGMAVDANIITYERIREELRLGKSVMSAFKSGNRNSLSTIFDANITTLLAAVVLFSFGTSSVKGFATMLIVSILVSFLTAVYGSRLLLGLWVNSRIFNNKPGLFGVKQSEIADIATVTDETEVVTRYDRFDFVKHRKKFFIASGVMFVLGIGLLLTLKLNLGIDFASGTRVEILAEKSLTAQEVTEEFRDLGYEPKDVILSGDNKEIGVARFIGVLSKDEIAEVKTHFQNLYGAEPSVSTVSPTVGKELARNAFFAVMIASIGIIIYVTIRFEMIMAIAAIIALLHDAFFIIMLFSLTRLEVDITFIAAILTIVGYSINDTIVTFDRIRELMKKSKRVKTFEDLSDIVNKALRQTLGRSVSTVITVVFVVLALLFLGAESITNFSFALLVGLIAGTYSSLFLASQLWLVWKHKQLEKRRYAKIEDKEPEPEV
ncbi:protein translocase subunit SecDF [Bacillus luteolus]|uniref:Multifunctional fusion protein n=1 Tax=Litchfieldia luteola TaxID=682179 RepID=A0ABR9QHY1_9BACI|nr:protein translocase subunit SecDF [Cytobacillus luteolus]MBE4908108.1 protein translocase subunit SecDF [Cytobacillus luteolus]MBP1942893.1 SecD/SecF fusion protein [Cytobacillus luteolus]